MVADSMSRCDTLDSHYLKDVPALDLLSFFSLSTLSLLRRYFDTLIKRIFKKSINKKMGFDRLVLTAWILTCCFLGPWGPAGFRI
jgi:hypothetical protein